MEIAYFPPSGSRRSDLAIGQACIEAFEAIEVEPSGPSSRLSTVLEALTANPQPIAEDYGHEERAAVLSLAIARELGVPEEEQHGIWLAGLLHDVGKRLVPSRILLKRGPLTEKERRSVHRHPIHGLKLLEGVEFPWPVKRAILEHHERLDGSGYPFGLVGSEIALESQIVAVADVADAIASPRPYRKALGIWMALEELQAGSGILFRSDVVQALSRVVRRHRPS